MKEQTKTAIESALRYARIKHPQFAKDFAQGLLLAQEELGEAIQAYNNKDTPKMLMELSHTTAVLVRILNNEFTYTETGVKPK